MFLFIKNSLIEGLMAAAKLLDRETKIRTLENQLKELKHGALIEKLMSINIPEKAGKGPSEKAKKIKAEMAALQASGYLTGHLPLIFGRLVSLIIEEELPGVGKTCKNGDIVVLVGNPNGHGYMMNTPYIVANERSMFLMDAAGVIGAGGQAPFAYPGSFAKATSEQIEAFTKDLSPKALDELVKVVKF